MLKHAGHHHPTVIIESDRGVYLSLLNFLPETTLEKQKLLFTLGHDLAMEHDIEAKEVTQLVWICEAWFTRKTPDTAKHAPKPPEDPTRQEGLIVLVLNITGRTLSQEMRIIEVVRHGALFDLLLVPADDTAKVQSGLLTSALAGVVSASLSISELTEIFKKHAEGI